MVVSDEYQGGTSTENENRTSAEGVILSKRSRTYWKMTFQ